METEKIYPVMWLHETSNPLRIGDEMRIEDAQTRKIESAVLIKIENGTYYFDNGYKCDNVKVLSPIFSIK